MANIKQIVLKDAEGNVLGTYDIKDDNVPHSSESAVSGGTTLSLVTTGEKYNWDNKSDTDTKNTAGATDGGGSKLYVIGATSQTANPQTYSKSTTYLYGDDFYAQRIYVKATGGSLDKGVIVSNSSDTVVAGLSASADNGSVYLCSSDGYGKVNLNTSLNGGSVSVKNANRTESIRLEGETGTITCSDVSCSKVFRRDTLVASSTAYSADNMRGQTRFLYTTHGVPHSGTTVAFDSSNTENYSMQLNGNYSGATANARLSFRTRNGDANKWSNWLYCCPVHRFNTRIEPNTSVTLYVPQEMRNGTYGDSYFLVLSGNYGTGGLYFLTPNTASSHTMTITAIKSAGSTTLATVSDDWGFKITLGSVAYYATLIRLS